MMWVLPINEAVNVGSSLALGSCRSGKSSLTEPVATDCHQAPTRGLVGRNSPPGDVYLNLLALRRDRSAGNRTQIVAETSKAGG